MYKYVEDKHFINLAYQNCSDMVNQLVQRLKKEKIKANMRIAGSKSRNMVMRNGKGGIDFDFNLIIEETPSWKGKDLKDKIMNCLNEVLDRDDLYHCCDSTSVISTQEIILEDEGVDDIPFKIDICIVRERNLKDGKSVERLIHHKKKKDQEESYPWETAYKNDVKFYAKVEKLKRTHWIEVRKVYKAKRNMYLSRQDDNHPAFICYIETINEVHNKHFGKNVK